MTPAREALMEMEKKMTLAETRALEAAASAFAEAADIVLRAKYIARKDRERLAIEITNKSTRITRMFEHLRPSAAVYAERPVQHTRGCTRSIHGSGTKALWRIC